MKASSAGSRGSGSSGTARRQKACDRSSGHCAASVAAKHCCSLGATLRVAPALSLGATALCNWVVTECPFGRVRNRAQKIAPPCALRGFCPAGGTPGAQTPDWHLCNMHACSGVSFLNPECTTQLLLNAARLGPSLNTGVHFEQTLLKPGKGGGSADKMSSTSCDSSPAIKCVGVHFSGELCQISAEGWRVMMQHTD